MGFGFVLEFRRIIVLIKDGDTECFLESGLLFKILEKLLGIEDGIREEMVMLCVKEYIFVIGWII